MTELRSFFESDLFSKAGSVASGLETTKTPPEHHIKLSQQAVASLATKVISLPVGYQNLLQILLTSAKPGEVSPFYVRSVTTVPAGQTVVLEDAIPPGKEGIVVFVHNMFVSPASSAVLVTHQADNQPPLLQDTPGNYPMHVEGSFLPPVRTRIVHTVINNDTIDVEFTDEVQSVTMSDELYRDFFLPLMRGQVDALKVIASQLTNTGSVG